MKRHIYIMTFMVCIFSCMIPLKMNGQAQISTKKVKISNFTTSITKVVIDGNNITDQIIRDEITARWRVSPFEFCSVEEYESLKEDSSYYFLLTVKEKDGKYSGLTTLTLTKGGKDSHAEMDKQALEVATLPICSSTFPSGRELILMPAFIDIIQDYVSKAILSDRNAYKGFRLYNKSIVRTKYKNIYFCEDDLSPELGVFPKKEGLFMSDEDTVDSLFTNKSFNSVISYVIAPYEPEDGMACIKMLIDAESHRLYYFSRHSISSKKSIGFLRKDMKVISKIR